MAEYREKGPDDSAFQLSSPSQKEKGFEQQFRFLVRTEDRAAVSSHAEKIPLPQQVGAEKMIPKNYSYSNQVGYILEAEAASYLIPLLDPIKDKKEIKWIQNHIFNL